MHENEQNQIDNRVASLMEPWVSFGAKHMKAGT